MKILINPPRDQWDEILKRPQLPESATEEKVSGMLGALKESGWSEVCRLTNELDGYLPEPGWVDESEVKDAGNHLPEPLRRSIIQAADNIRKFHESQAQSQNPVVISRGITCYQKWIPVDTVGLYIPGGTAPLFSTVLMLAIPAQIAGCREIVLCTPGDQNGQVNPSILFAASWCGISRVYRLGGVQAIASMAYGLGPVPRVDKIFGPGNTWVTLAKQLVNRAGVAIDLPAGPSELMIVADDSANPAFVAADLLSQAEHGTDSQVIMITSSWEIAEQVHHETEHQLSKLPRKAIAGKVLDNSKIVVLHEETRIIEMVNRYAPEHLIIATEDYKRLAEQVRNAGSVFLGNYSPESAGDYATGTNHTLPTSGYARAYSGLSLLSFMKSVTFQELTPEGLRSIEPAVTIMARAEGLEGHARAAEIRQNEEHSVELPEEAAQQESAGESIWEKYHLKEYLNPLNLLYPLNILDPESDLNPENVLKRILSLENEVPLLKPTLSNLMRPNIVSLVGYSSARDEYQGREGIFLDANENPRENGMNRYPDPRQSDLRDKVAKLKGVDPKHIFLGNGSDEAIDVLIRIFCEPRNSRIITMDPSYGMYGVCAGIQDVAVDRVLLNTDFTINTAGLIQAIRYDTRMIFLCSPNNPTGNQIPLNVIRILATVFSGIIVIDEAYIDFASGPTTLTLLKDFPNLVVLQTFSKAWGLAGIRLGMAFADPEIIGVMNKVKYPYNVNTLTASTAAKIIGEVSEIHTAGKGKPGKKEPIGPDIRLILTERIRLAENLREIHGIEKVYPSEANFLLVKFKDPKSTYKYLAEKGIIVRDRSNQSLCEGCLRITVGTPEENDQLIEALRKKQSPSSK